MINFDEDNLPTRFLIPPVPAPHEYSQRTWARNYTLYFVSTHWAGKHWGKLEVLADWVAALTGERTLSKQRIQGIIVRTHWLLTKDHYGVSV